MMETKARKKLLLAVQTSSSEGLGLDNAGRFGRNVRRGGEGPMKDDTEFGSGWYQVKEFGRVK